MAIAEKDENRARFSYGDGMNILDLMFVLSLHWRMIVCLTILGAVISATIAIKLPRIYESNSRLLVLEFIDQTDVIRIGNDGRLVRGKTKGVWKPADISVIKSILERTERERIATAKLAGISQYCATQIRQDKQPGIITVKAEGTDPAETLRNLSGTIEKSTQLAFRMGLLATPTLALDDLPKDFSAGTMVVRLIEPPEPGIKIRPKQLLIIILSTTTAMLFSIILIIMKEFYSHVYITNRERFDEIKTTFIEQNQNEATQK